MGTVMSYDQIYKALMSEGIEEYVPDGVSLSHPVVDYIDGRMVDCFLLFSTSRDGLKYTAPTARIIIDSANKKLVEFRTTEEMPFSVYDGTDYFSNDVKNQDKEKSREKECEYQTLYVSIRAFAFHDSISIDDKRMLVSYIKSLKSVEYTHLQPFVFELGQNFFKWAKRVLQQYA